MLVSIVFGLSQPEVRKQHCNVVVISKALVVKWSTSYFVVYILQILYYFSFRGGKAVSIGSKAGGDVVVQGHHPHHEKTASLTRVSQASSVARLSRPRTAPIPKARSESAHPEAKAVLARIDRVDIGSCLRHPTFVVDTDGGRRFRESTRMKIVTQVKRCKIAYA